MRLEEEKSGASEHRNVAEPSYSVKNKKPFVYYNISMSTKVEYHPSLFKETYYDIGI